MTTFNISVSHSLGLSDVNTRDPDPETLPGFAQDVLQLSDEQARQVDFGRAVTELISLSQQRTGIVAQAYEQIAQSLSLSQQTGRQIDFVRAITHTLSLSQVIEQVLGEDTVQSLSVTDLHSFVHQVRRVIVDSLVLSQVIVDSLTKPSVDSLSVGHVIGRQVDWLRTVVETLSCSDAAAGWIVGGEPPASPCSPKWPTPADATFDPCP